MGVKDNKILSNCFMGAHRWAGGNDGQKWSRLSTGIIHRQSYYYGVYTSSMLLVKDSSSMLKGCFKLL